MKYYPKSQLEKLIANPEDNLFLQMDIGNDSRKPYIGPYIKTIDNLYYTGESYSTDVGENKELIRINDKVELNHNGVKHSFGIKKTVKIHSILKNNIYKNQQFYQDIPSSKPFPTEKDYKNKFFTRFFIKKINEEKHYKEISFKTFDNFFNPPKKIYDNVLYKPYAIRWDLSENAIENNEKTIEKLESNDLKYVSILFPILNQYQIPILDIQTNLSTKGKELYYENGEEYIGEYHIHPKKGPMEGPTHIKAKHAKLYYLDQLPKKGNKISNIDDDFEKYLEKQRIKKIKDLKFNPTKPSVSQDVRSAPSSGRSTPSRGSSSTSGGRGGGTSGGRGGGY